MLHSKVSTWYSRRLDRLAARRTGRLANFMTSWRQQNEKGHKDNFVNGLDYFCLACGGDWLKGVVRTRTRIPRMQTAEQPVGDQ